MQQRLIVVDLDGTALANENEIAPLTKKYLIKAQEQGHQVTIATGRQFYSTEYVYNDLGLSLPCLSLNGAIINDRNGNSKIINHMEAQSVQAVLEHPYIQEKVLLTMLETPNKAYLDKNDKSMIYFLQNQMPGNTGAKYEVVEKFGSTLLEQVPTMYMFTKVADGEETLAVLNGLGLPEITFRGTAGPESFWIEGYSTRTNKAAGLEVLAKEYGIAPDRIIAFGDQMNDVEMLQYADIGVAMQNAHDYVKSIANEVTEFSNADSGVGLHLAKLLDL